MNVIESSKDKIIIITKNKQFVAAHRNLSKSYKLSLQGTRLQENVRAGLRANEVLY